MAALKVLEYYGESITLFGIEPINESMMVAAERLLMKCIDIKSNATIFDQLRWNYYHFIGSNFDVGKIRLNSKPYMKSFL